MDRETTKIKLEECSQLLFEAYLKIQKAQEMIDSMADWLPSCEKNPDDKEKE